MTTNPTRPDCTWHMGYPPLVGERCEDTRVCTVLNPSEGVVGARLCAYMRNGLKENGKLLWEQS